MATTRKRVSRDAVEDDGGRTRISNGNIKHHETHRSARDLPNSSTTAVASTILTPALVTTFVLIFGGCCSNVYTLESILSLSPDTGSLVTFLQFLLTAVFTLPSQLTTKRSPDQQTSSSSFIPRFRSRNVPLHKWLIYTTLFLAVNVLNNSAFKYRISIPLHIILRSAGPVTSMLVGYLFAGRRYETRKIAAVMLLFCGVVLAAMSDASSKGEVSISGAQRNSELSKQIPGFILLFAALVIAAFMGLYADELYKQHGRNSETTNENLFYSHVLSLPFLAIQYKDLYNQFVAAVFSSTMVSHNTSVLSKINSLPAVLRPLAPYPPLSYLTGSDLPLTPILLLLANAFTQIICITGVNRLSTQTTSLTVSIVLNVRKLISLLLSIWLFGNKLPPGVTLGAVIVFLGGGLYALPSRKNVQNKNRVEKKDK